MRCTKKCNSLFQALSNPLAEIKKNAFDSPWPISVSVPPTILNVTCKTKGVLEKEKHWNEKCKLTLCP